MFSHLKRSLALAGCALLAILIIAGCGSAAKQSNAPSQVRFNGKLASLAVTSPFAGSSLPGIYTCIGRDITPPFTWGAMPPGTKQLALFILGFTRSTSRTVIKVRYAAAGLNPALQGVQTGELPRRSIAGRNSAGKTKYSICPAKGSTESYAFLLFALPKAGGIHQRFNASQLLHKVSFGRTALPFGAFLTALTRP